MKQYYLIKCLENSPRQYFRRNKQPRNLKFSENAFVHGVLFVFTYFVYLIEQKNGKEFAAELPQSYLRRFVKDPNLLAEVFRFFDSENILIARRNQNGGKSYKANTKATTYEASAKAAAEANTLRRVSPNDFPIAGKTPLERFNEYQRNEERHAIESLPHVQRQKEDRAKTFFDNSVYEAAQNKAESHHQFVCHESAIKRFLDTGTNFVTNVSEYGRIYSRATEIPSDLRPYLYFDDADGVKRRFAEVDVKTGGVPNPVKTLRWISCGWFSVSMSKGYVKTV